MSDSFQEGPADGSSELVRFRVRGRRADRKLIRSIAVRLSDDGPNAMRLRAEIAKALAEPSARGGVVAVLLVSPLVGASLDLARSHTEGRTVEF